MLSYRLKSFNDAIVINVRFVQSYKHLSVNITITISKKLWGGQD